MFSVTDALSACAFKVSLNYRGNTLGSGTAFLVSHHDRTYIVTARHNLTARNAYTGAPISTPLPARFPDELEFRLPYEIPQDTGVVAFDAQPCALKLWSAAEPLWYVFDPDDLKWDVAVLDLSELCATQCLRSTTDTLPEDQSRFLADTASLIRGGFVEVSSGKKIRLAAVSHYVNVGFGPRVGDDVFVLGYPRGIDGGQGLPIWKRGTIASEPLIPVEGMPLLLVDTATRQGMSGAPVVARQHRGTARLPRGHLSLLSGEVTRFVGLYSSRDKGADEFEAQLGRVWTADHVVAIIEARKRDKARL